MLCGWSCTAGLCRSCEAHLSSRSSLSLSLSIHFPGTRIPNRPSPRSCSLSVRFSGSSSPLRSITHHAPRSPPFVLLRVLHREMKILPIRRRAKLVAACGSFFFFFLSCSDRSLIGVRSLLSKIDPPGVSGFGVSWDESCFCRLLYRAVWPLLIGLCFFLVSS